MKKFLGVFMKCALLSLIFLTGTAFANDGGLVYVDVKGIDPQKKESIFNTQVMEFYGKQTKEFMQLLPPVQGIYSDVEGFKEGFRSMSLVNGDYVVTISCASGELYFPIGSETPVIIKFPEGERCAIFYNKRDPGDDLSSYLGDSPTKLDKDKMVCEQN